MEGVNQIKHHALAFRGYQSIYSPALTTRIVIHNASNWQAETPLVTQVARIIFDSRAMQKWVHLLVRYVPVNCPRGL